MIAASLAAGCSSDEDGDGYRGGDDCDDADPSVHVQAFETCAGVDQNCDGAARTQAATVGEEAFATVQEGIDAAGPDEVVMVCPGTYVEDLVIESPLVLRGVAGQTNLEGTGDSSVVFVSLGATERFELSGFTVSGGVGSENPNFNGAVGGGLHVLIGGEVAIRDSEFFGNVADYGGGLFIAAIGETTIADVEVDANVVGGLGGGLYLSTQASLERVVLDQNRAQGGAGLFSQAALTIADSTLSENSASSFGGAMYGERADIELVDTSIEGNEADVGGGLFARWGGSLAGGSFTENSAEHGGGIFYNGGDADALFTNAPYAIDSVTFEQNEASGGGGGIFVSNSVDVQMTGLAFLENTAVSGGAVYIDQASVKLADSTVFLNVAQSGGGVGINVGMLTSDDTDWGDGGTDNVPNDVIVGDMAYLIPGVASFTCRSDTEECG